MNLTRIGNLYLTPTGEFFGELLESVGPYGTSTGEFCRCETTAPLSELGVTEVNGLPVEPFE